MDSLHSIDINSFHKFKPVDPPPSLGQSRCTVRWMEPVQRGGINTGHREKLRKIAENCGKLGKIFFKINTKCCKFPCNFFHPNTIEAYKRCFNSADVVTSSDLIPSLQIRFRAPESWGPCGDFATRINSLRARDRSQTKFV